VTAAPSTSPSPSPAIACPVCGAAAVPGDRFCEACGADLPYTEPPAVPAAEAGDSSSSDTAPVQAPGRPCASCGADAAQIVDGYCGVCGMKQPALRDHSEVAAEGVAAVSDRGRRHHRNEDAFALRRDDSGRVLAVVCDGVSTTVNPDQASAAAADAALEVLAAGGDLVAAAAAAQDAVEDVEGAAQPPELGWPSCTFLAGVVSGSSVDLATLGDCRTFWLPLEGAPEVLTEDDSWAADQVASGAMTAQEAYASPMAHTITRWLGHDADPSWQPRLAHVELAGTGRLVLCSDGLWNYAPNAADVAAAAAPLADDLLVVAQRLVTFANDAGGHDNITVVVVDIGAPPAAEPTPVQPGPDEPSPPAAAVDSPDPAPAKGRPE
jgi:serine/threonine protein phosphatase PrpC